MSVQAHDAQRHLGIVLSPFEQDGSRYIALTQMVLRSDLASWTRQSHGISQERRSWHCSGIPVNGRDTSSSPHGDPLVEDAEQERGKP